MALALAILNAIAAIPKIGAQVELLAGWVASWWIQRQKAQTLQQIVDAAALGMRAQTDEDRYKVSDAWQSVLQSSRVSQ